MIDFLVVSKDGTNNLLFESKISLRKVRKVKILLERAKGLKEINWWVGEIGRCYNCGCTFQLEELDRPKMEKNIFNDRDLEDFITFSVKCPQCKVKIDVRKYCI